MVNGEKNIKFSNQNWKMSRKYFLNTIKEAKLKAFHSNNESSCNITEKEEVLINNNNNNNNNVATNMMYCSYCKRTFGMSVIIKHEIICGKLYRKKHFNV